jgi:hypothetical protein
MSDKPAGKWMIEQCGNRGHKQVSGTAFCACGHAMFDQPKNEGEIKMSDNKQTAMKCTHDRLNEDGVCRACGMDCRGGVSEMPDNKPSAPQFTPGPWTIGGYKNYGFSIWAKEAGCIAGRWWPSRNETIPVVANAYLIAAAPDMYAALQTSQHVLEIMLNFGEKVEEEALKGMEGCLWPVEEMRAQIEEIKTALAVARGEK